MGHHHAHHHSGHSHHDHHTHEHGGEKVTKDLWIAFLLNLTFTILEFIGGFFSNSMAVMTDAVHDLGDTVAIGSALFLEKYSTRGRDTLYSYGYRRYSPMAAFINGIILIIGSVIMLSHAIPAIFNPSEVKPDIMLGMAILGIIFNGLAVLRLRHGHAHSHGTSHNRNVVMLHLMEDVLGWVAVLIGSLVIRFTGWHILDPILSVAIALYILFNAVKGVWAIGKIFLQTVPDKQLIQRLETQLKAIPGVKNVHDLHAWTMDGNYHVITVHLLPEKGTLAEDWRRIQQETANIMQAEKVKHYTIQIDMDSECAFGDC
ncbi:MAG: cation diffusion facilitator family transporter [Flavobacteriales bacterium]|nr:cation diffusion facilitator family transporter [Flavobacteriales bacterium]